MTLTRESDHQRGLRSVVGELIEHVRHYDIPDEPSYAAFVDAWADRIHAASGVPRMQQQMAEDRKALAAVRAEQAAEVERLRAALEKARQTAMTMLRAERVCERSHRDGERNAHVHEDVVHDWAVALVPFARAALAATPTLARRLDLGTAWDEAVAALPEGWHGPSVAQNWLGRWYAYVYQHSEFAPDDPEISAHVSAEDHATPTEALVALAEALRERAR